MSNVTVLHWSTMNAVAVHQTSLPDTAEAAQDLANALNSKLSGTRPDALVVFASPQYDFHVLLRTLKARCGPGALVGCSSAGEFTERSQTTGSACALALASDEMTFSAGVGRGITASRQAAAHQLVSAFHGMQQSDAPYRSALVLTDALGGFADDLIQELTLATAGRYQIFGGGAGDDGRFQRTHVFCGEDTYTDAAVALEIVSRKPLGIGVKHGWIPASKPMRVTEAEGMRLISLNARPAVEVVREHAAAKGARFDPERPLDFFFHNVFGVDTGVGYKLRVPLSIHPDGSITCAAEIPTGATICIMETSTDSAAAAAREATKAALQQLGTRSPRAAVFFDCVATRLRLGKDFGLELEALRALLPHSAVVGCNTYGQIARVDGQFSGFHNCTAVVCLLPD